MASKEAAHAVVGANVGHETVFYGNVCSCYVNDGSWNSERRNCSLSLCVQVHYLAFQVLQTTMPDAKTTPTVYGSTSFNWAASIASRAATRANWVKRSNLLTSSYQSTAGIKSTSPAYFTGRSLYLVMVLCRFVLQKYLLWTFAGLREGCYHTYSGDYDSFHALPPSTRSRSPTVLISDSFSSELYSPSVPKKELDPPNQGIHTQAFKTGLLSQALCWVTIFFQ